MTGNDDIISWTSLKGMEDTMGVPAARVLAQKLLGFLVLKVEELEKVYAAKEPAAIEACLHKLASNAAALGALKLSQHARALEAECRNGQWDSVMAQRQVITALARASLAALQEKLG